MKNLGANDFNYGYPEPVLMVAIYNDDETVNVMNLHECTRTNAGDLALCIGEGKKLTKILKNAVHLIFQSRLKILLKKWIILE